MSKHILTIMLFIAFTVLNGCGGSSSASDNTTQDATDNNTDSAQSDQSVSDQNITDHALAGDYIWESSEEILITLDGETITTLSSQVTVESSVATITKSGVYRLSGTLTDGQIIIDTDDEETVQLILDDVSISSSTNAPLNIQSAEKTVIILAEDTQNILTDASEYVFDDPEEDEPNAALYSKDDLSIYGGGTLTVHANYNDGITSKDGLVIDSGTIVIDSVDDGIRGKDYLVVKGGDITVDAYGDCLKSDNEDADTGYISIEDGTFDLTSYEGDGIAAESDLFIASGGLTIKTADGSTTYLTEDSNSMKGMKAGDQIIIDNGTFNLNCADDAIHSNNTITINNGNYTLSTADDAIHSDIALTINSGTITINESYEGIESGTITINGGTIYVTASDDGINAASDEVSNRYLYINGGYIVVDSEGDGIDVNGMMQMTDGTVIIHGPIASNNGALDYDMQFSLQGGLLVAVGSSRMAQAPSSSSTQYTVSATFNSTQSANTLVHIQDSSGNSVLTFEPKKAYESLIFSSADLVYGSGYSIYLDGTDTGTQSDGLYQTSNYTPGTLFDSFTISSMITSINTAQNRR
ncbi:MAG: carbohydrate-binding domain-containing protein [Epsilonproteobacteria bacterium]|nr:carbohydrate-binding domain-containing protein [Campylobacterota bacterium]